MPCVTRTKIKVVNDPTVRIKKFEKELGLRPVHPLIIDNQGLSFSRETLHSGYLMHHFREQYYGAGWLGKRWCQKIRPRLAPKKHRKIQDLYETSLRIYKRDWDALRIKLEEELE